MNGLYTTQRYAEGNGTLTLFGRNWKANKTFVTIWTEQVFFVSIRKIKQIQHLYKCLIVIFIFELCVLDSSSLLLIVREFMGSERGEISQTNAGELMSERRS